MFDKLLELLSTIWESLLPFVVIDQYEGGVVLRLGKFHREIGPGVHWRIPFGVDRVISEHVVSRTHRLDGLTTTTIDGKAIGFDAVITYRISDIQKAMLEVSDMKDAIADSCAGIIGTELSNAKWDDIVHGNTVENLTTVCRKRAVKWGVRIESVQLTGVATVKNLRVALSQAHQTPALI